MRNKILLHSGNRIPRGELWLGTPLFEGHGLSDTPENHLRLADRLDHDLISLPVSDSPDTKPDLQYRYFGCEQVGLTAQVSDQPVFAVIDGPFQEMVSRIGLMSVLADWIPKNEEIRNCYKKLSASVLDLIDRTLQYPVSAVVIADDFVSDAGPLVRPSDIETLFSPFYDQASQSVKKAGAAFFLHCCGNLSRLDPIIASWRIEGLCAVQSTVNDLNDLFRRFDPGFMIMAGIEPGLLESVHPPRDLVIRFKETVRIAGRSGKLILGTSCGLFKLQQLERIVEIYAMADQSV